MITSKFRLYILGLLYVIASLLIGEQHPFTVVPMYSSFANYAYSFYLSDSSGKLIPEQKYFNYKGDYLSHIYGSICDKEKINCGNQIETDSQLSQVGKAMLSSVKIYQIAPLPACKIQINRICYFLKNDSIKEKVKMMYEETTR